MVFLPRIMKEAVDKKFLSMNIRFSAEGYKTISEFCKKHGLKMSHFCENAVLSAIRKESLKKRQND